MPSANVTTAPPLYEAMLGRDRALSEGSHHFEGKSSVQDALVKVARRLDALGVSYAVAEGMALFRHGYRRFTDDVAILVAREALAIIHDRLDGLGYLPPFTGSKNRRDTENGVKIEFLIAGEYPGDGKPKPVAFPDPDQAGVDLDGIRCLNVTYLVELKLASALTRVGAFKDLGDLQELIKTLGLPRDFV